MPAVTKMKCERACNENFGNLDLCLALISPKKMVHSDSATYVLEQIRD